MNCPHCQATLLQGAAYCSHCGTLAAPEFCTRARLHAAPVVSIPPATPTRLITRELPTQTTAAPLLSPGGSQSRRVWPYVASLLILVGVGIIGAGVLVLAWAYWSAQTERARAAEARATPEPTQPARPRPVRARPAPSAPTEAPPPVARTITRGVQVVAPGQLRWVTFTGPGTVTGRFEAQGGGNDIRIFITDADGLANARNGHPFRTWFDSGKLTVGTIQAVVGEGEFALCCDNTNSILSNKIVTVTATIE